MTTPLEQLTALADLVRQARWEEFVHRAVELEPADLGDVLAQLSEEERLQAVHALPPEISAEALVEMPEEIGRAHV